MSTVRRVAKNTLVWFFGDIVGKILSLAFVIYAARYLHAEGYGILSFALAFTGMFGILSDIGFYELIVREVARDKQKAGKYIGNVIILKSFLVAIMFGLLCATINMMNYPSKTVELVLILGISIAIDAFSVAFHAIFHAFERMEFISLGKILKNAMFLAGVFIIIYGNMGLLAFAYLYLIGSLFIFAYSFTITAMKFARPKFEMDKRFCKWLIKEGLPFWASSVFIKIYYDIDKVMLSMMVGDVAVGWYSAAYRLVVTLGFIPTAFIASIYPVTSRLFTSSKDSLKFATERAFKYLLIIGIPIGILTTELADKIILSVYGTGYAPSTIALQILVWSEVLIFVNVVFGNLLNSINRQIIITYATAIAAILNVIMNLLLIPKYSFVGASIATVATEAFMFVFVLAYVMRSEYRPSERNILSALIKVGTAGFAMCILLIHKDVVLIPFSIAVYVLTLYLLKGIDEVDWKFIKQILMKEDKYV